MGVSTKKTPIVDSGQLIIVVFAWLVWPTPYWYLVVPGQPPNSANEYDKGIATIVVRISRLTGRTWVMKAGTDLNWQSMAERQELAENSAAEIVRRCKKAEDAGSFNDIKNLRIVELKGYAFPCK
jgi:hypothetical protein